MPKDDHGHWVPDLFGNQIALFNCYKRAILASGPRLGGKSHATQHKVLRHLWEVKSARVAMFSRTLKLSKDGGPWSQIQRDVIPEWVKAGIGFRYTTVRGDGQPGPKVDGQTRTPFFKVTNMHGGESECLLFSMDNDNETEEKLKEMAFSMIYFSELSKFNTPELLSVALPLLRMKDIPFEYQQFLADTNPSEDGDQSWIYKNWYLYRGSNYEEYCKSRADEGLPTIPERIFYEFRESLALFEFPMMANPHLDPRQINEVVAACANDIGMYSRLVEGKWVYGTGDRSRHFRTVFKPNVHIVGNTEAMDEDEWIVLLPSEGCHELITGLDLGETNHAGAVMESQLINGKSHFAVLDELVTIGEEVSIESFTEEFMRKIEVIEAIAGHPLGLDRCWGDQSAFRYQATADNFAAAEVQSASNERLLVQGVQKPPGSIALRVDLLKRLLRENRFKVSANCVRTIDMLKNLKKGKGSLNFVVKDENKHVFDAITYALLMECAEELYLGAKHRTGKKVSLSVSI